MIMNLYGVTKYKRQRIRQTHTVFHKNQESLFYKRVNNCFSFLSGSKSAR